MMDGGREKEREEGEAGEKRRVKERRSNRKEKG